MTAAEIIDEIRPLGTEAYKKSLKSQNIPEPWFGVKVEDMKKIVKREKKNYELAKDLYDTGIYDAMYLAGLLADDERMTKDDLSNWLAKANCGILAEYTVPWVASESLVGRELALEWIESKDPREAAAGWSTWASLVSIKPDSELDLDELKSLLKRVETTIHDQPARVRWAMNWFLICAGGYVGPVSDLALETAKRIGKVKSDSTGCGSMADAADQIDKMVKRGTLGRKRKTAKC
jgi:3-methyladenine DNA glycosylase AlkD